MRAESSLRQKLKDRPDAFAVASAVVCAFIIYFWYFPEVFFAPNEVLCGSSLDSIKNYFTFAWHARHDGSFTEFKGMNYPFGEHVVYTDCQPLISGILRWLPFLAGHSIGILHALLFASFILTPAVLFRVFRKLDLPVGAAWCYSLAITLLSPQFAKISAGHFSLAYGCLIPVGMLLLQRCFLFGPRSSLILTLYTTLVFLIHPYLGAGLSLFSMLALLIYSIPGRQRVFNSRVAFAALLSGAVPNVAFRLFMHFTDHHPERTSEPFGLDVMVENITTLLVPRFGPFASDSPVLLPPPTEHFEGHSYLGMAMILFSAAFIILVLRRFSAYQPRRTAVSIFFSSVVLLLIAFGWHRPVLSWLHIDSPAVNQFRAVCRFAYFFYYAVPVLVIPVVHNRISSMLPSVRLVIPLVFLLLTVVEAHFYFKLDRDSFWKFRNVFNASVMSEKEKHILAIIQNSNAQAVMPLPVFHGGSEVFDRLGSNRSYVPAMQYAYHAGLPVFSALMSRTSIPETEQSLDLLNTYRKDRPILGKITKAPFFTIITADPLLPDEERIARSFNKIFAEDSLQFGFIHTDAFRTAVTDREVINLEHVKHYSDSAVVFIDSTALPPFSTANMNDYAKIITITAGTLRSGDYVVSFHNHYSDRTWQALAYNLVVEKISNGETSWEYNIPVRVQSGFYTKSGVFEYRIRLDGGSEYNFLLKGFVNRPYHISSFMLRPANTTVITRGSINNFPVND